MMHCQAGKLIQGIFSSSDALGLRGACRTPIGALYHTKITSLCTLELAKHTVWAMPMQVQDLMQLAPECPEFPDLLSTIKKVCSVGP